MKPFLIAVWISLTSISGTGFAQTAATLQAEIQSLYNNIVSLQSQLSTLRTANATLQTTVANLQRTSTAATSTLQTTVARLQTTATATVSNDATQFASIAAIKAQLSLVASNPVLALGPFVTLDLLTENGVRGPNVVFHGCNVHIVSGSGFTNDGMESGGVSTGLGNLVIGYNQLYPGAFTDHAARAGCHNLIMGDLNRFPSYGGFVSGSYNFINGPENMILGGTANRADGYMSVIVGGVNTVATGGPIGDGNGTGPVVVNNIEIGSANLQ